jgi:hypothetical protein
MRARAAGKIICMIKDNHLKQARKYASLFVERRSPGFLTPRDYPQEIYHFVFNNMISTSAVSWKRAKVGSASRTPPAAASKSKARR